MATDPRAVTEAKRLTASALQASLGLDGDAFYRLVEKLSTDAALLGQFKSDPEVVARREGVQIPNGFHLHYVGPDNKYEPDEAAAIKQLHDHSNTGPWSRVEVRYAIGPLCVAACGVCNNA